MGNAKAQFDPGAATSRRTLEFQDVTTGEVIIIDQCVTRRITTETDMWSVTGITRDGKRQCEFRMNVRTEMGVYVIT